LPSARPDGSPAVSRPFGLCRTRTQTAGNCTRYAYFMRPRLAQNWAKSNCFPKPCGAVVACMNRHNGNVTGSFPQQCQDNAACDAEPSEVPMHTKSCASARSAVASKRARRSLRRSLQALQPSLVSALAIGARPRKTIVNVACENCLEHCGAILELSGKAEQMAVAIGYCIGLPFVEAIRKPI